MNEDTTRKILIDKELEKRDWNLKNKNQISEKSWIATFDEIKEKKWNLDAARYKPIKKVKTPSSDPIKLLDDIKTLEDDIITTVNSIKKDLKDFK